MAVAFFASLVLALVAADPQRPETLSETLEQASRNLKGFQDTTCTGSGTFPEEAPLCYSGQLLVQQFAIKVLSHDSTGGTVDMEMRGPVTNGACSGAAFVNNENDITVSDSEECNLGDSEYTVKYCGDLRVSQDASGVTVPLASHFYSNSHAMEVHTPILWFATSCLSPG
eukprot:Skav220826  [mRNA]  locus=scaffold1888:25335:31890:+ [translate_table: standard]